ncbi:hypothetical protein BP6252_13994 [Coleophoma cylindrospora]|uniref:Uncharacterized protein n=1 Tax=Coleophoma cylindrospora TaxID=1849047 RepID=A0A3D8Q4I6_9HELO|nr:hypothetical protein BP6252_13994 [Coleophoma cylindrospora]
MSSPTTNQAAMNNTGRGPLRVPGFGGIPIEYELECEQRFAHGVNDWKQVPAVTAREFAMVAVMNTLTDQPEWQVQIFDDEIVARWRKEAFVTTPLMSEKAWTWCVAELRDKAVAFEKNQYIRVLDTGSCVCKSDTLISDSLAAEFRLGIAPLLEQPDKDWEPGSDGRVLNLVNPSFFPLVYGRSLVLTDGGQVDLDNVLGSYSQAQVAPTHLDRRVDSLEVQKQIERGLPHHHSLSVHHYNSKLEFYHWSSNFQWLPCEAEFCEDQGTDVRITSYINNLHPSNKSLYRGIEKLISLAIKPWNDCLIQGQQGWKNGYNRTQRGRIPLRIITYGVEWENELPEWALAFNMPSPYRIGRYKEAKEMLKNTQDSDDKADMEKRYKAQKRIEGMPDVEGRENMERPTPELWKMAKEYLQLPDHGSTTPGHLPKDWDKDEQTAWKFILRKHKELMHFRHPEPGTAFTYEGWKAGRNNKAVIDMVTERPVSDFFPEGSFKPISEDHRPQTINLQDTFRKQGLQIIVKIDGIELTPDNPSYAGGEWQLEGQLNEHVVATAIYPYDVQNVTETRISFRQETPIPEIFYQYGTDMYAQQKHNIHNQPAHRYGKQWHEIEALAQIFGFHEHDLLKEKPSPAILPFQEIGSVSTPQGRLVTFPHTMEHRIQPFQLADPTLPGHHRSVALYLVDPHYRVCSTRNVPPQQFHWWAEALSEEFGKLGAPREISTGITDEMDDWLVRVDEAARYRDEIMKEHRWMDAARYKGMPLYGFW